MSTIPSGSRSTRRRPPSCRPSTGVVTSWRGGEVDPVEVSGPIGRVVVIEFPTFDAAKAYYHGDEYQRLTAIRQSAADTDLLLVDGYNG